MSNSQNWEHLKIWQPGNYRIVVDGKVDENWSDRLAGLQISTRKRGDQSTVSTLTGRVRDHAELIGVLNSLYELHLPILLVEHFKEKKCQR